MEEVSRIHCIPIELAQHMSRMGCYPPCVSYVVDGTGAAGDMPSCKIVIRGADVAGQDLFFRLSLESQAHSGLQWGTHATL